MVCLRCGYCCIHYDVIIVAPHEAKPDLIVDFEHKFDIIHKHSGQKCPYLSFLNSVATCSIHEYNWYKDTPCFHHDQISKPNDPCRIGEGIKKGIINLSISERRYNMDWLITIPQTTDWAEYLNELEYVKDYK